ncbi:MAG: KamA family radical SAM protein [Candidatus Ornithospirochaeta sp.]
MPLCNICDLEKVIVLREEEREWREDGGNTLPVLVSDHLTPLLEKEEIRRQFVPSVKENQDTVGNLDPQMEKEYSVTPRLVRRYKNRAAFLVTDRCFAYCRHCFRRRFAGSMTGPCTKEEIEEAAAFLKDHNEIKEVLLTGGDMFTLSDSSLDQMLSVFKESREDIIFRLCTRALTSCPERFTPSLFSVLEKNNHGAPFYLMTQFNHASEITDEAKEAVDGFVRLGIPMMNQCVLLRGVNDSTKAQVELANDLLSLRIKPYYLFQGDLVQGTSHLRVPLSRGLEIEKEMREELSGLSMPQYTIDLPQGGGKVPLYGGYTEKLEDGVWTIRTLEGDVRHYPEDK